MIILAISWLPSSVEADSHLHQINIKFGEAFERTMVHWRYDYNKLDGTKAGVACVQWSRIDQTFLEEGIFEAIGFSYSMAKEKPQFALPTKAANKWLGIMTFLGALAR